jgi:hypothetical protein
MAGGGTVMLYMILSGTNVQLEVSAVLEILYGIIFLGAWPCLRLSNRVTGESGLRRGWISVGFVYLVLGVSAAVLAGRSELISAYTVNWWGLVLTAAVAGCVGAIYRFLADRTLRRLSRARMAQRRRSRRFQAWWIKQQPDRQRQRTLMMSRDVETRNWIAVRW